MNPQGSHKSGNEFMEVGGQLALEDLGEVGLMFLPEAFGNHDSVQENLKTKKTCASEG